MDHYSGNPGAPAGGPRPAANGGPQSQAEGSKPPHGKDPKRTQSYKRLMAPLLASCPDEWQSAVRPPAYLGPRERDDYVAALLMADDTVRPTTGLDWCDLRQFAQLEAEIEQLRRYGVGLMVLRRPEIVVDLVRDSLKARGYDPWVVLGDYRAGDPEAADLVHRRLVSDGFASDVIDARTFERNREVLLDLDKRIAGKRMQQHRLRQAMDKRLQRREAERDRVGRNEPGRAGSGSGGSSSGGSGADAGHGPRPEPSASFNQGGACATGPGASAEDGPAGAGLDTAMPAPANPGSVGASEAAPSPAVGQPPSLQGAAVTAAMGPAPTSLPLRHPDGRLVLPGEIWDESWQESGPAQGTGPGTGLSPEAARADAPVAGRGGEAGQGSSSRGSPHQASSGPASPGHGHAPRPTDRPVGPSGSQPSRPPHPHRPGEGG